MNGDLVGRGQSGDGDKPKGQAAAPPKTTISGQSEGAAPQPSADQNEATAPDKRSPWPIFGHVWRGVRHTKLTDWLIIILTAVIAYSAWSSDKTFGRQLSEMKGSGVDTHNLAVATGNLVGAANTQATASASQATAAGIQATAMDKLRSAGEAQATAAQLLADAGRAQADSTKVLAAATGRQLAAIQAQADAARVQAVSVGKSAEATIIASKATDRLAISGKAQADAVLQSLSTAREANKIAADASAATNRPWVSFQPPVGEHELIAGADYQAEVSIANPGRSPATNAQITVEIRFLSITTSVGDLDACSSCARLTLFPAGGFGSPGQVFRPTIAKEQITPEHLAAYNNFTEALLIRARADYTDSAGAPHHTFLCAYYVPKAKGLGGYTSCSTGNKAD